ncbi:MAG TPA: hypothetical protein VFK39_05500 [Gemmatimonadaceae bacterium]|nr:hypothetical protein [Gemmatimonadaceae bacterium]
MYRSITGIAIALLATAGCARTAQVESGGDVVTTPLPTSTSSIPVGTTLNVTLDQTLGTEQSKIGDDFTATVSEPLNTTSGALVVPKGAVVHGKVTGLHASEHAGDQAAIKLDFDSLTINGQSYAFDAKITNTDLKTQGGDTRNETLKKAGIGAAAGAALGAILGDASLGKIALGGLLGAAAGTAISLGAGDVQAVLPEGTPMTIQSTQMVALR